MEVTPGQLCEEILQFMQHYKSACTELADQYGLTLVQMAALHTLERQGQLPMGKVAETLHCDASNVTGIVDRLVAQGLIERHECPEDRRAKTLQLTNKGQDVTRSIQNQLPERLGCDMLDASERTVLRSVLAKLATS